MTVRLTGFVLILALLGLSGYAALENARRASLAPAKPASPCTAAAADYQIERSSCSTSAGVAGRGFAFAPGR